MDVSFRLKSSSTAAHAAPRASSLTPFRRCLHPGVCRVAVPRSKTSIKKGECCERDLNHQTIPSPRSVFIKSMFERKTYADNGFNSELEREHGASHVFIGVSRCARLNLDLGALLLAAPQCSSLSTHCSLRRALKCFSPVFVPRAMSL